jgi:hypothetical protein
VDANDARVTKLPFWRAWTLKETVFAFGGPVLIVGAVGWVVRLFASGIGAMFDDANIGATVVGTIAAFVALVVGWFGTSRLLAATRGVVLEGPCPSCGAVGVRLFESVADPKSPPTACGRCVAYLRAASDKMCEESADALEMIRTPYVLVSAEYLPAVRKTNRGFYRFDMPTMCAVCGDAHATHHREIGNGDAMGTDLGALGAIGTLAEGVADVPFRQRDQRTGSTSEPTDDDRNSKGLSKLTAPVCAKHTKDADYFGDPLEYSSGTLKFASYRYYKAFCELNHIERAPAVTG